jgi:hypothetical protein
VDAWALVRRTAKSTVDCLIERWWREGLPGLPTYAQFDNDTVFQVRISSPMPSGASAACAWRRASSRPQRPTPRAGRRAPTLLATLCFDPSVPVRGTLIYLRRTDAAVVLNSSAERSRSRLNGCIAWFVARSISLASISNSMPCAAAHQASNRC